MQFRLFYEGRFLSANGDPMANQSDKRAGHKHNIRREFHKQLRHLWQIHPTLSKAQTSGEIFGMMPRERRPLNQVAAENFESFGFKWVPLVCGAFDLLCKIDVLLLRRDRPGGLIEARDIDNRLKVLFDALKMPRSLGELADAQPQGEEEPFYVLLESDDLITSVSVETDDLLSPQEEWGSDDSYARVIVHVTITPYSGNMFNLAFV